MIDRAAAVRARSTAGSSARRPRDARCADVTESQNSISESSRPAPTASETSSAYLRTDVPTGASAGSSPFIAAMPARARSSRMMRHETPSTTAWWMTSNSRPGPVTGRNRTALTIVPSAGFRRPTARSVSATINGPHSSSGAGSARVSKTTATSFVSGTSSLPSEVNVPRSASWRATRASSAAWTCSDVKADGV